MQKNHYEWEPMGYKTREKVIKRLKRPLKDMNISTRILLFYAVLLLFSVLVSSILFQRIYSNIISRKVSQISIQMLTSIDSNIISTLENANNYSKIIFSSEDIQDLLRNSRLYEDLDKQNRVHKYLIRLMEGIPIISSTYLFDNTGNNYAVQKMTPESIKISNIREASWYKDVIAQKGSFLLRLNAGGIFEKTTQKNYVSLIRVINDIQTQERIGILVINIPESVFVNAYKGIVEEYNTDILLLDENDHNIVTHEGIDANELGTLFTDFGEKEYDYKIKKLKGRQTLVSYIKTSKFGWKIVSVVPFDELSRENSKFSLVAFIIIIINSFMLFIGSFIISRRITVPIKKLLNSMKGIEKGEFKKVDINTGNDEFGKLRDGYNIMILEIEKLINRVVEEQKIKRKAELDALQAQIKPHFLYNTFDAISYLALSGRCEEVYDAIVALGNYYRTSLSKGSEVITIADELEIVKNYLTIQKIRYGDLFTVNYDIDERLGNLKILKLVLQPLVENALYHGIKPKCESGTITISVKLEDRLLKLTVADDGVGIGKERLKEILDNRSSKSFGLMRTMERLRIFYGVSDIYTIESHEGVGTTVTVHISVERVMENG